MNSNGSKNLSLKYLRFTSSSCRDIGICGKDSIPSSHFLLLTMYTYKLVNIACELNFFWKPLWFFRVVQ